MALHATMAQVEQGLSTQTVASDNDDAAISFSDARRQIVASCLLFTLVIQVGTSLAYSSVLLPQLRADDSAMPISSEQASWIASLFTLMIPAGSLLAGPLMDRYGRKTLSMLTGVPFAVGWLAAVLATDCAHLYASRVLTGLAAGFSTVCLVYCSELAHPMYRPMLLGLNSVFVSLGILITCSMGVAVPWRIQAGVYCGLSLVTVVLHLPLPESPHWLQSRVEVEHALRWIYRRPDVCRLQLRGILRQKQCGSQALAPVGLRSCLTPIVCRPAMLLTVVFLFQQLSGAYVVIFYAVDIFREVKVQYEDFILIMFGAIRFVMAVVSLLLSRVFGRRLLLFVSGTGMCLSCFLAFGLRHNDSEAAGIAFCVLMFVCFGALGFLGVPWTLIGELFPVRVKGVAAGFMITIAYLFMFVVVKMFPILLDCLDIKFVFLIFSVNSLFAVFVVYRWLPETFGVSFSEIEKHFR